MTKDSTVGEVIANPALGDFGRLLFPVDRAVSEDMTLAQVSTSSVYVWYSNIQADKTVEIVNDVISRAEQGEQVFYPIYTKEEMNADPSKRDTGLFFFRGEPGEKFAVVNAGGGFMYVGAMHDSFPHALAQFGRPDIPQAAAVIMQYTGYTTVSEKDAPTYACVGTNDGIASWLTMQARLEALDTLGIPTEFHAYEGLGHGFGLGTGTVAEGWIEDAVNFWDGSFRDAPSNVWYSDAVNFVRENGLMSGTSSTTWSPVPPVSTPHPETPEGCTCPQN